jgi:hypothetical protein
VKVGAGIRSTYSHDLGAIANLQHVIADRRLSLSSFSESHFAKFNGDEIFVMMPKEKGMRVRPEIAELG